MQTVRLQETRPACPSPFHIWVDAHMWKGRLVGGRWRAKWGMAKTAKQWMKDNPRGSIHHTLVNLGIDRSKGRHWRQSGRHPALRWNEETMPEA